MTRRSLVVRAGAALMLSTVFTMPAVAQHNSAPETEAYWSAWWSNNIIAAEEQLDTLEASDPDDPFLLQRRGFHQLIYRNDPAAAVPLLERAYSAEPDNVTTATLLARAYLGSDASHSAISTLMPVVEEDSFNMDAALWLAEAQLAVGERNAAIATLSSARDHVSTSLHINRVLHRLSIEEGDYATGYTIWRDENLFALHGAEAEIAVPLDERYAALANNPAAFTRLARAQLFWDLRMMNEALFELTQDEDDTDPELLHRTRALLTFTHDLDAALNAYYADRIWSADAEAMFGARIWPVFAALDADLDDLEFELMEDRQAQGNAAIEAVEDYFPIEMTCGGTGGFLNCHGGYEVYRSTHHLDQWGRQADVESQVLKWMFNNGLQAWAWDFAAQTGGWNVSDGDTSTFVNVIDPKFGAATSRVRNFIHGDPVDVVAMRNEAITELDGEVGYSEALESLLIHHHFSLFGGDGGPDQEALMIASYFDFIYETSTVVHEGQHFIDAHSGDEFENWELEFRAKLSEIAYGSAPFLTFYSLYGPSLDEAEHPQPHPRANVEVFTRILDVLIRDERYVDVRDQGLVGLLNLSEDQIREIARTIWVEAYGPY